jgi:SAM-dependent methyltransferase
MSLPLVPPTADQAQALRVFFERQGYTTAGVCERLAIGALHEFTARRDGRTTAVAIGDGRDVAIRLFLDAEALPEAEVAGQWSADERALLAAVGLVESAGPGQLQSTMLLYPLAGLWLVSDVAASMRAQPAERPDVVYPAMTANTFRFLKGLPESRCERFLELCGGTGAAALLAARGGAQAWTADIAERSTQVARFNAALNGIEGCTAVTGDLYDAVPGAVFDRIAAHPPYVATPTDRLIFRDGGADGEAVTRRIVAGLPAALAPGGRLYLTCMATDRTDAPLEQRVRGWLGEAADGFDVDVFVRTSFTPEEYYAEVAKSGQLSTEDAVEWVRYFERLDVRGLVYAWIVVTRHAAARSPATRRRHRDSDAPQAAIEAILDFEAAAAAGTASLAETRLALRPSVRLIARLRSEGGLWVPEATVVENTTPLRAQLELPPVAAAAVARFDGSRTVAAMQADALARGELPESAVGDELARLAQQLVSAGFAAVAPPVSGE